MEIRMGLVSKRTESIAEKFRSLGLKGSQEKPTEWYPWPHEESSEGILIAIINEESIAARVANTICLYGLVSSDKKISVFEHQPDVAHPNGFFTVCVDPVDVNLPVLDSLLRPNDRSPRNPLP